MSVEASYPKLEPLEYRRFATRRLKTECFSAKVITYPEPKTVKESPPRYHQKNI